jgi:hypothetical protein
LAARPTAHVGARAMQRLEAIQAPLILHFPVGNAAFFA